MTEQEEFDRLCESIDRWDQVDPEEVDENEYLRSFIRMVELREKGLKPLNYRAPRS